MPLGFFSGGSSSAKPQPLASSDSGSKERRDKSRETLEKDARGTVLRLQKTTVTVERKLAEGGFAIVYLVTDKQNRHYAVKRQFIKEDERQVEACRREYSIISNLKGHKNIVSYVDHYLAQNKAGIYDYMLLTAYYKTSVLQLMNDRLAVGRALSAREVLSIFCDMCEAVARLHHSQTPVIHRDLKVENILVDDRNRAGPPIYVLCDFGSATTKVLSAEKYTVQFIIEEIDRYTTLSYRAPEMIDVYEGRPIGTKSDIWALGVMLYKLSFFCLPFAESALAIQNGAFSFPPQPEQPEQIKAVIKCLLVTDIDSRPVIYQAAELAFQAAEKPCPVLNVFNVAVPDLSEALESLRSNKPMVISSRPLADPRIAETTQELVRTSPVTVLTVSGSDSQTTSVNPRLRPKPTNSVPAVVPVIPSPKIVRHKVPSLNASEPEIATAAREYVTDGLTATTSASATVDHPPLSCPLMKPADLGFTDLEDLAPPRERAHTEANIRRQSCKAPETERVISSEVPTDSTISLPSSMSSGGVQGHRRNASDTSQIIKSAFKPYSQSTMAGPQVQQVSQSATSVDEVGRTTGNKLDQQPQHGSWNPFMAAPYGTSGMDDSHFGQCFDELPRKTNSRNGSSHTIPDNVSNAGSDDYDGTSIDSRDPFGAAPFEPLPPRRPRRSTDVLLDTDDEEMVIIDRNMEDIMGVGHQEEYEEETPIIQNEEDSELDEQRMHARRRYSYEHIDGVGDDASSDSRGRTDHDSTDELSKNDESSHDEENESSQHTDVAESEDGTGSRPLLEDDELEEEDDYPITTSYTSGSSALYIDSRSAHPTNPFLHSDDTPKMSPAGSMNQQKPFTATQNWLDEVEFDKFNGRWAEPEGIAGCSGEYAPATLPRQATPLTAAPKVPPKPVYTRDIMPPPPPPSSVIHLSTVAPQPPQPPPPPAKPPAVATAAKMASNMTAPPLIVSYQTKATNPSLNTATSTVIPPPVALRMSSLPTSNFAVPIVYTQPQPIVPPLNQEVLAQRSVSPPWSSGMTTSVVPSFIEGPKTPRSKKGKEKEKEKDKKHRKDAYWSGSGSELETDGSEAEMFSSVSSDKAISKKKKKSAAAFNLRGSHPSVLPIDNRASPSIGAVRKISGKKMSTSRRDVSGALNASFVNSSFQAEDIDSPPNQRMTTSSTHRV